jgi:hypothetical protein
MQDSRQSLKLLILDPVPQEEWHSASLNYLLLTLDTEGYPDRGIRMEVKTRVGWLGLDKKILLHAMSLM